MTEIKREPGAALSLEGQELVLDKQIVGGRGMGKLADGRPAFVSGGFSGDRLKTLRVRDKRSFVEVLDFELLEPSAHRVTPPCDVCSTCGGCDWMPLTPAAQNGAKSGLIREALERIGRFPPADLPQNIPVESSPQDLRYRSRVRLQLKNGRVGFFSRSSHELVEVDDCIVSSKELWEAVALVRDVVRAGPDVFAPVVHVEVRVFPPQGSEPWGRGEASAWFVFGEKRPSKEQRTALVKATSSLAERMQLRFGKEPGALQEVCLASDVRVSVPIGGFTQVNDGVNRVLIDKVLSVAQQAKCRTFLDLYCGCGNFAIPLAAAGLEGVGVERAKEPIAAAQAAADAQDLNVRFHATDSRRFMDRLAKEKRHFDIAVVDPPRAGAKEILQHLVALGPTLIVMISCDPGTFARDLRALVDGGYSLETLEGLDMFPQTHHVESFAVLQRSEIPRLSSPGP